MEVKQTWFKSFSFKSTTKDPLYGNVPAYLDLALRPSAQGSSVQHFPATFYQHFQNKTDVQTRGRKKWTSVLTLIFGASSWLTETDTSVCLDVFKQGSSSQLCPTSEAASLDLLVLPVRSSLNWTVYGWSWLTIQSCCPGFNLATLSLPTTKESTDVGFTPSWGKRLKTGLINNYNTMYSINKDFNNNWDVHWVIKKSQMLLKRITVKKKKSTIPTCLTLT